MSWSALVVAGVVAGIVLWGGFHWVLELTNTEAFCVSCHEMRDTVYPELQQTIHWKNRSGVRASCPDCHVPKPWIYKIRRKIEASNELLHKILGTINTPEKFEAHRLELAQHVWATNAGGIGRNLLTRRRGTDFETRIFQHAAATTS